MRISPSLNVRMKRSQIALYAGLSAGLANRDRMSTKNGQIVVGDVRTAAIGVMDVTPPR
jgi:hypothetical protein